MLKAITNRSEDGKFSLPGDGWFQLVPRGEYPVTQELPKGEKRRVVQVVDAAAVKRIVNRFEQESKQENFAGVLIDFDHFSTDTDKSSEAAGWVNRMEGRADGVWGQVRWTDSGEAALLNGRFRFISPVWDGSDVEKVGEGRIRPVRVDSLGLTNAPNMREMKPLSNRGQRAEVGGRSGKEFQESNNQHKKTMQRVATELGLSPEAAEDVVLGEVRKIKNRTTAVETELGTAKGRITTLETENKGLLGAQVESDLERFKNRFKAEKRDVWKNRLMKDRAGTLEILEDLEDDLASRQEGDNRETRETRENGTKILNRRDAKTPGAGAGGGDKIKNREGERMSLVNRKKAEMGGAACAFELAWNAARSEKPELFATES